jgi:hypothetical protein
MPSTYGIKIYQYNIDGTFVNEYESINAAQDLTSINNLSIAVNNKKNMCSAGGYIWTLKYYLKLPQNILDKYDDRLFERFNVPIFKYDISGNLIEEFQSLSKITKIRQERNCIRSVLKGEARTFKNHIYLFEKYEKLPKSFLKNYFKQWKGFVLQFDLKGNLIKKWKNSDEASKELKISRTNIDRSLKKQREVSNGFIWKYENE